MNILSAKIDQVLANERRAEFSRAKNKFETMHNVFNQVNSRYSSSEENYLIKKFEEDLTEYAYENLQSELSRLRFKEKSIDNTDLVNTKNIIDHEIALKQDSRIVAIESKLTSNQSKIKEYQHKLITAKSSQAVISYERLSRSLKSLYKRESNIIELIGKKAEKGKDTDKLEAKLELIRKEIEEKEKKRNELQPSYDECKQIEKQLESLLNENDALVQERLALDPELVRFSKVDTFFDKIIQGNGNGLGVDSDISRYKAELSDVTEVLDTRSDQTTSFQELLNKNLSLKMSVKSDLDSSRNLREQKEQIFQQIKS